MGITGAILQNDYFLRMYSFLLNKVFFIKATAVVYAVSERIILK